MSLVDLDSGETHSLEFDETFLSNVCRGNDQWWSEPIGEEIDRLFPTVQSGVIDTGKSYIFSASVGGGSTYYVHDHEVQLWLERFHDWKLCLNYRGAPRTMPPPVTFQFYKKRNGENRIRITDGFDKVIKDRHCLLCNTPESELECDYNDLGQGDDRDIVCVECIETY